ncbi:MAG: Asp-tRNA(Asn)/Glu-tRNA(Gln) amidotransferase subunit GatA [Polyangia bacterium]
MSDELGGVVGLAEAVRAGRVSAVEVTRAYLQRIAALDPRLGCFLHVDEAGALQAAAAVDAQVRGGSGSELSLAGVPVALKDNLCTAGLPTTAGSKILAGFVPPYDATVVARLKAAGAIVLGKLNLDEFAMGSSNERSAFFPCKNPWDEARVPGGSSGGAAAAVAADLCALALGSDTGGSIRQPAALCGVTGLKPTYGRVSRYGLIAFASSLDQVGPLSRSAHDAAAALQVIGGPDPFDATSLGGAHGEPRDYLHACNQASPKRLLRGLRIGLPREYFQAGLDPQIASCVHGAIEALRSEGAETVEVSLPLTQYAVAIYYLIATAEASSNLARYDGVRYGLRVTPRPDELAPGESALAALYKRSRAAGFGAEVKRRILLGTYVLRSGYYDAYYRRASQVRTLVAREFAAAFEKCDVLATPTSPVAAFRLGERLGEHTGDPLSMYLADIYTIGANLAGLPGISVPCGFVTAPPGPDGNDDRDGGRPLPAGLQLIGPALHDDRVLAVATAYQHLSDWHKRRPSLTPRADAEAKVPHV